MRVLVSCGGRGWLVELPSSEMQSEISDTLGMPVRSPSAGGPAASICGRIRLIPEEKQSGVMVPRGIRRDGATLSAQLENMTLRVRLGTRPLESTVTYGRGAGAVALRSALRLLCMHDVLQSGGLVLHASSVRTNRGLLLFAGKTGSGKTTAAGTFPEPDRVDDDLVLLECEAGEWVCPGGLGYAQTDDHARSDSGPASVRAIFLPSAGSGFKARVLPEAEAAAVCVNLPCREVLPDGAGVETVLEAVTDLVTSVPVVKLQWSTGEDLPALLSGFLGELEGR